MSRDIGWRLGVWLPAIGMLIPATLLAASAAPSDVRLAPVTAGAIRLTVSVPSPRVTLIDSGERMSRIELAGYSVGAAKAGSPALPSRVITVAVPPLGDVQVHAVATELEVSEGVNLQPQPVSDGDGTTLAYRRDLAAYGAEGSRTPRAARLLGVSWLRNQRVARIAIEPAAYEPSARRLSVARRVDVEVQVQPVSDLGEPAESNDPYESVYRSVLVNFEQGRTWRRPATARLVRAARRMGLEPTRVEGIALPPDTSVFAGRTWLKFEVRRTGFYSVNYSRVRNLFLFNNASAPFDSLRMFTLPGRPVLPEGNYCDSCDYKETALGVIDVLNDGLFGGAGENDDTFYFFAQGPSGWADDYDPGYDDTVFVNHPYETVNHYYLTLATLADPVGGAPLRIAQRTVTPSGAGTLETTIPERQRFEQDLEYWPDAASIGSTLVWEKWFWRSLGPGSRFEQAFDLVHADTTQPARMRSRQWGLTHNFFCPDGFGDHALDVTMNNLTFPRRVWDGITSRDRAGQTWDTTATFLKRRDNRFAAQVPLLSIPGCSQRFDRSALAWFEIYYRRTLEPDEDRLDFHTDAASGTYRYDVGPFTSPVPPRLFDITEPLAPVELLGANFVAGTASFEDARSGARRYLALPESLITRTVMPATDILEAPFTSLENLRSSSEAAEYLVVYYDGFRAAADSLVEWRRFHLPLAGRQAPFATKAVPISALYDQFSGGRTDPAAIRNFLRAAFFNWSIPPRFVTFLGDASYDYKNITGRAPAGQPGTLLPTYENRFDEGFGIDRQYATDDWILDINNGNLTTAFELTPDFYSGRLPANDPTGALQVVRDKILLYERTAPLGEYRNQVMLIADDDAQGEVCDPLGWTHVQQTTQLDTTSTAPHMDRVYVYLHTYASGAGATKPGARKDIKDHLNSGVAMFNYVGHGSPFKISDESVFIDSDAGTLTNGPRMPLFVAASCDVGKFNDPTVQSLGERLVMTPNGGCIGVVSATELALSGQNSALNLFLYSEIFNRDDVVVGPDTLRGLGQYHTPVSGALLSAKVNAGTLSTNNSKYQLMGDAAFRLNLPRLWAEITVTDVNGIPATELRRGQTLKFRGRMLDQPSGSALPFDGVASILIEDSAPNDNTGRNPYDGCYSHFYDVDYRFRAGTIYHGDVSVANGQFEGRFVVPLDAVAGAYGRVRAYVSGRAPGEVAATDAAGSVRTQVSPGSAPFGDTQGPRINLAFVGGSTSVRPDATLRIDLFDDNGIMTTGHSLQNSIVVTLDDNTTSRVDVTSTFRYAADSYQSGTARFVLPGLSAGRHKVKVSAADNLATGITASQHRSFTELEFDVVDSPPLRVERAYLFPTPARSKGAGAGGVFVVDAPGDSVNTLLRIYTVTGKLVRVLKDLGGLGQVQIPWDGLDAEGAPLANGTYLFKVHVNVRQADGTGSASQKAAAEGRFVIVNR